MTACFKLLRVLRQRSRPDPESLCASCVYFGMNLDALEYPVPPEQEISCGLGYQPGEDGCSSMRTDNCSARRT